MSREELESFVKSVSGFDLLESKDQILWLCFYLQKVNGSFTASQVFDCIEKLGTRRMARLPQFLSEKTKGKNALMIKVNTGYAIERKHFAALESKLGTVPKVKEVSSSLEALAGKITDLYERQFLEEALICYRAGAGRGAILMLWELTFYHLQKHIFDAHLAEFNVAIVAKNLKGVKTISTLDDFAEIKESLVIEFAKSAGIISGDTRKILDEKLGIRNSASHPSRIVFDIHKVTEFALDLMNNVVLKY